MVYGITFIISADFLTIIMEKFIQLPSVANKNIFIQYNNICDL